MTAGRPLRDAGLALSLLTAVPTPATWPEDGRTQVAGWFPAVGLLVGAVGYTIIKLAEETGALRKGPFVVAAIVVIAWALITRLLHWDGLADVGDGYWGSHDVARRLEIMSDSHTGAFGVAAVVLIALLEVSALGSFLPRHQLVVLIVPAFARFAATAAAWLGKPARDGGLGRSVMGRPTVVAALAALLVLGAATAAAWVGYGTAGLVFSSTAVIIALGVPHVLALRFGGVTGDVMGASVLLTEALAFAFIALVV